MPTPSHLATGALIRWNSAACFVVGGLATIWIVAAAWALRTFVAVKSHGPLLAPAALVLLVCGLLQAWMLLQSIQRNQRGRNNVFVGHVAYWRRLVLGTALAYLAALAVGPLRSIGWAWLAGIAVWQTMLLLPLAASPQVTEHWRRWTEKRTPRYLSWLVYAAMLLLFASEGALRVHRLMTETVLFPLASAEMTHTGAMPDAALAKDSVVPLERLKSGRFRVALVGPSDVPAEQSLSVRVQQNLPGAEIVTLPIALNDSKLRVSDVTVAVDASGADLVLVVLPVCEDLSRERAATNVFDWRHLELAALIAADAPLERRDAPIGSKDFETFLGQVGPQLAACRTPLSDVMHARWQRTYATLDRTMAGCRQADVPLALVVVPGEFQLNSGLRDTLLRRSGVSPDQFDPDLPQRRLAGFAQQRGLPLVDLLPHLRICREAVYQRHATSLNDRGNQAAASAIGGWLTSRFGDRLAAQLSKAP